MKMNTRKIYISEIIILLAIIVLILTITRPLYYLRNVCIIASLGVSFIILILSFGWKKDNNYLKRYTIRSLIALMMTYIIIIYGLGIILGFNKGFIAFNMSFFKSLVANITLIVLLELVRYMVAKNTLKSKLPLIIFTILSSIMCVLLEINIENVVSSEQKFIFLSTIILPIIAQETLCSYLSYKVSFIPSIIFKLVVKLYYFVIPIVPNLGDYIYSAINVLFPYIIYLVINGSVVKYEKVKADFKKVNLTIFSIPLLLFFVVLIILVSGIFRYRLIAIASNSMHPAYNRGDAVIYKKIEPHSIEIGDIIAFTKEGRIITHRVTKIEHKNNSFVFSTKGDNNEVEDAFTTNESNILGKVTFSFKYIGYPTVKINEIFGKE